MREIERALLLVKLESQAWLLWRLFVTEQLFSDHIECEKSSSEVGAFTKSSCRVASESYLNVLTNQITLYDDIKLAYMLYVCVCF